MPDSPSPAARTREPSLTPAGMRTSTMRAWPPCLIAIRRVAPWNASSSVSSTSCSMSRPFCVRGARPVRVRGHRRPPPPPKNVRKKSENGSSLPNISCISSSRHRAIAAAARCCRAVGRRAAPAQGWPCCCACSYMPPVGAELVVLAALLGIAEHLVGLVDLLELRLGRLVARVDVRDGACAPASGRPA